MDPLISIIIPIYNVKPFLRQCIDSTGMLGSENVEIILVNDGSTDGCSEICRDYDKNWDNVILVEKSNGGLSDARNVGTTIAKGEYIYYLDSDDWLVQDAIITLYHFAKKSGCDVVQGGFYYAYDDYCIYDDRWIKDTQDSFVLNQHEAMRELLKNNYIKNFAWGKLYKSSVVKAHPFPFGKYYEDSYWQHLIINDSVRYGVIPASLYYYRQRKDSISGTESKRLLDLYKGMESQLVFIKDYYPDMVGIIADRIWLESYKSRNKDDDFMSFYVHIKDNYSSLLSNELKESCFYKLAMNNSRWLSLYVLCRKINGRLKGRRLKRIGL